LRRWQAAGGRRQAGQETAWNALDACCAAPEDLDGWLGPLRQFFAVIAIGPAPRPSGAADARKTCGPWTAATIGDGSAGAAAQPYAFPRIHHDEPPETCS